MAAVEAAFARFEAEGVRADELERVKAGYKTEFYGGLSSVLGKAFQLAQYNIFAPSPGYLKEDLARLLAVTAEDVMAAYEKYIKGRPYVAASFVPRGQLELALEGSQKADVVEEPIVQGAEAEIVVVDRGEIPRTPSSFDRSIEPPFGDPPSVRPPEVFQDTLANGLRVLVIEDREMPLVQFHLRIRGGLLLEDEARVGVSNLLAEMLTEGTATKTPEELELAIDKLGASIRVNAGRESFDIRGSTLARNYRATMDLVEEILLEPRWDPQRFALARQRVLNELRQRSANPSALAQDAFARLLYGDHIMARNPRGSEESVQAITLEDLKRYHAEALAPGEAAFHVAGAVSAQDVLASLGGLASRWEAKQVSFPDPPAWSADRAGLYFLDVPDAKQSVLAIGYLALAATDPDYYPASVMNFRLGTAASRPT